MKHDRNALHRIRGAGLVLAAGLSLWGQSGLGEPLLVEDGKPGAAMARADYLSDRKAAMGMARGGTNEAALALFVKLAEGPFTDFQKSDALEQAAMIAHTLKRDDQAMELARKMPLAPASKTVQMRLMNAARKWREIVATFKKEDLDSWPESVAGEASHLRGEAYYRIGDGNNAEADLKKAAEYLVDSSSKGSALNVLGSTYATLLKDDARALDAYRRAHKSTGAGGAWIGYTAVMGAAGILTRQNKLDEALAELMATVDKVMNPYSHSCMLAACGNILAKQGKRSEAIAKYREAAGLKDLDPSQKASCEKIIRELEAGGK